jgi:hypothetical protein
LGGACAASKLRLRRDRDWAHTAARRFARRASRADRTRGVDQVPLGVDQRRLDFVAELDELFVTAVAVIAVLDVPESVAAKGAKRFDDGLRQLAFGRQGVKAFDRRLDRASADLIFLAYLVLSLAPTGIGETERAGHGGRQARKGFFDFLAVDLATFQGNAGTAMR